MPNQKGSIMRVTLVTILAIIILVNAQTLKAVSQSAYDEIDSLEGILDTASYDALRIDLLLSIGEIYLRSGDGSNIKSDDYIDLAILKSQDGSHSARLGWGYILKGYSFLLNGKLGDALNLLDKGLLILENEDADSVMARKAEGFQFRGSVYFEMGDFEKSIKDFISASKIYQEKQDQVGLASVCRQIGDIFCMQKQYPKAAEYLNRAIEAGRASGNAQVLSFALNSTGILNGAQNRFVEALDFYQEAANIMRLEGDTLALSNSLNNMAVTYHKMGKLDKAQLLYEESLSMVVDAYSAVNLILNIGISYQAKGDHQNAIKYYQRCLSRADSSGIYEVRYYAYEALSSAYEQIGQYKEALEYSRQCLVAKDSLHQLQTAQIEAEYANQQLEQEVDRLENDQLEQRSSFQTYLWWSGSFIAGVLLFSIVVFRRRKRIETLTKKRYEAELGRLRALKSLEEMDALKRDNTHLITIPILQGEKHILKPLADILCFKADQGYVLACDCEGNSFMTDYTMGFLEQKLQPSFLRVHRTYLVNTGHIKSVKKEPQSKAQIILGEKNKMHILSGRSYLENVNSLLKI